MRLLLEIAVFVLSVAAGLFFGGLLPEGVPPKTRRLPIAALLVGTGIAIAAVVFSSR